MKTIKDLLSESNPIVRVCDLGQLEPMEFVEEYHRLLKFPNTTKAVGLVTEIETWFASYAYLPLEMKQDTVRNLLSFCECSRKPWFTDISSDRIYRGISRTMKDMPKVTFRRTTDVDIIGTVAYDPKMAMQSWSTDMKRAESFRSMNPAEWRDGIPWLLTMKPQRKDIVFGNQFTKLISAFPWEREVVVHFPRQTTVTVMIKVRELMHKLGHRYKKQSVKDWDRFLDAELGKPNADFLRGSKDYDRRLERMVNELT